MNILDKILLMVPNIFYKFLILVLITIVCCGCTEKWTETGCPSTKIYYKEKNNYVTTLKLEITLSNEDFINTFGSTEALDSLISSSYKREDGRALSYKIMDTEYLLEYVFNPSTQVQNHTTGSGNLIDKLYDSKGLPQKNIELLSDFLCVK